MIPFAGLTSAFGATFAAAFAELARSDALADLSRLMAGIVAPARAIAQPGTRINSRYSVDIKTD
jgi:hypothetical protein